jgi:hypothetical protein
MSEKLRPKRLWLIGLASVRVSMEAHFEIYALRRILSFRNRAEVERLNRPTISFDSTERQLKLLKEQKNLNPEFSTLF